MANEQVIQQELVSKFPSLAEKITVPRERRMFVEVAYTDFHAVIEFAAKKLDFTYLCTITGQDEGENLTFMYHLSRTDGTMLNLKTAVPKAKPVMQTITHIYQGAVSYERELVDMLGAQVEGLPPGNRYPLPEGWPEGQYPLRKDWKPEMLDAATKAPEVG